MLERVHAERRDIPRNTLFNLSAAAKWCCTVVLSRLDLPVTVKTQQAACVFPGLRATNRPGCTRYVQ